MYTLYGVGAYWCLLLVELSEMCLVQRYHGIDVKMEAP